jgi:hypothetical protein
LRLTQVLSQPYVEHMCNIDSFYQPLSANKRRNPKDSAKGKDMFSADELKVAASLQQVQTQIETVRDLLDDDSGVVLRSNVSEKLCRRLLRRAATQHNGAA